MNNLDKVAEESAEMERREMETPTRPFDPKLPIEPRPVDWDKWDSPPGSSTSRYKLSGKYVAPKVTPRRHVDQQRMVELVAGISDRVNNLSLLMNGDGNDEVDVEFYEWVDELYTITIRYVPATQYGKTDDES